MRSLKNSVSRGKNAICTQLRNERVLCRTDVNRRAQGALARNDHWQVTNLLKTVHTLFTPRVPLLPASGLEIRNRSKSRQEKSGRLFLHADQKNLDEKSVLKCSNFFPATTLFAPPASNVKTPNFWCCQPCFKRSFRAHDDPPG